MGTICTNVQFEWKRKRKRIHFRLYSHHLNVEEFQSCNFAIDDSELQEMATNSIRNNAINNKWALKNIEDRFNQRRKSLSIDELLEVLLTAR